MRCGWRIGLIVSLVFLIGSAAAQTNMDRLELRSTDIVQWRGRDGSNFLIVNMFEHSAKLKALAETDRNALMLRSALVEGAIRFAQPENAGLQSLSLLLVSMQNMSEYGSGAGWTKLGAANIVKKTNQIVLEQVVLEGGLPPTLPIVAYPYKEANTKVTAADVRFRMPERLYMVAGLPQSFFYENVLVSKDIEDYLFIPTGNSIAFATHGRRGLTFNPSQASVGEHDLHISVTDWGGRVIAEGSTKVVVVPADTSWQTSPNEPVRILIVGHSLPSMFYPGYIANFLTAPGNPRFAFVGGIKYWYGKLPDFENNPDIGAIWHQASPGYSFETVLRLYTDVPPANPNMPAKSPFMFKDGNNPAKLDMRRYLDETLGSQPPHIILLNIGDNDTFNYDPDKPDATLEDKFRRDANQFLDALRLIAPKATIGAIMPNTYNYSDRSFLHNYGPKFSRWRQVRNRQRYIELMTEIAEKRGDLKIVPSNFSVDSVDGMPHNSGTHFNMLGARQFAGSVYAWLKAEFAVRGGTVVGIASAAPKVPALATLAVTGSPASMAPPTPSMTVSGPLEPDWYQLFRYWVLTKLSFN
jgi:lysophospholipase L1-like esterase